MLPRPVVLSRPQFPKRYPPKERHADVPDLPFPDNPDPSQRGIPTRWGNSSAWRISVYQGRLVEPAAFLYDSHLRAHIMAAVPSGMRVQFELYQSNPVLDFDYVRHRTRPARAGCRRHCCSSAPIVLRAARSTPSGAPCTGCTRSGRVHLDGDRVVAAGAAWEGRALLRRLHSPAVIGRPGHRLVGTRCRILPDIAPFRSRGGPARRLTSLAANSTPVLTPHAADHM
jgi:hypothetical protein